MTLKDRIAALISQTGPISVAHFMALALHDPEGGYYAAQPGVGSDFLTAPEISQVFGECIGIWARLEWRALGAPDRWTLIEIGPGTGALQTDIARALSRDAPARAGLNRVLVETSPPLRARQAERLSAADLSFTHAELLDAVAPGPSLIIANELLDCLPIRQFVKSPQGWRERLIGLGGGGLAFGLSAPLPHDALIPASLRGAPEGAVAEIAPGLEALVAALAARLLAYPGRALLIDYGAPAPTGGDTLQAVRAHEKVDPLEAPGVADLTAHVDFAAVTQLAVQEGLGVAGPIPQAAFLHALGAPERFAQLANLPGADAPALARAHHRLTASDQMGELFQVLCLSTPALSPPTGF
jgi:NADH dehydrogenase [ubiquinone] 1 alpha subcomplex assembly factor 7